MNTTIITEMSLILGVRIGDGNPSSAISHAVLGKSLVTFACQRQMVPFSKGLSSVPSCGPVARWFLLAAHQDTKACRKGVASPGTHPRFLLIPVTLI